MNAKARAHILTFLLVFATLGLAFGLDRLTVFLREYLTYKANPLIGMGSVMAVLSLATVLLAFCVFWLYNNAFPALQPAAVWIIVGLGLLVSFIPVFYWFALLGIDLDLSIFMSGRYYFIGAGGLIAVAAMFALYNMKKASA